MLEKTTTDMLKNKVFLAEDIQRLYFVRNDHEVHSYSLSGEGVLLSVIGNSIHAMAADDTSLTYYDAKDSKNYDLRETSLMTFKIGVETSKKLKGQVQVLYSELARTLDFIGFGDILISLNDRSPSRKIKGSETFKIEMIKIQKEANNQGRFLSTNMIRLYFKDNELNINKVG
ncbi:MAG: hypothetical protein ACI85O_001171 [Saprospiraceae bacterium]|jgi:hypothetical protein